MMTSHRNFRFIPDTPGEDLWDGLQRLVDRLADLVYVLPKDSPVLLSGPWGSGKTTLLRAVRRKLEKDLEAGGTTWEETDDPRCTVWFDAWRYEGETALLPALVRAVWKAMPEKETEEAQDLYEKAWGFAGKVALKYAPEALRMSGLPFGAVLADNVDTLKEFLTLQADTAKRLNVPEADPAEKLWDSLSKLLEKGWGEKAPVIFIDDLDRCSPEGAVALLDALRMLVSQANELRCHFILAIDRPVVASAIGRKFEGIGHYDGNRYLEKIFPISFELPEPRRQEAEKLVRRFLTGEAAEGLEDDHRDALTQALAEPIFANPRLMKRCINRFRLVIFFEGSEILSEPQAFSDNTHDAEKAQRDRILAKWITAAGRWPALRPLLGEHGDPYWREVSAALTEKQPVNDRELDQILTQRGARGWLRREMLSGKVLRTEAFREADQRLRRWGL